MKAQEIGAYQAKTHLPRLLEEVRRGRRVAELRPVPGNGERLRFGCDKGRIIVRDDFDAPIPGMDEYTL